MAGTIADGTTTVHQSQVTLPYEVHIIKADILVFKSQFNYKKHIRVYCLVSAKSMVVTFLYFLSFLLYTHGITLTSALK